MKNHRQIFDDYLEKNRLKTTPQRKTILEMFLKTRGHFSAEEFYDVVKRKHPTVGQATVYRTLRHLSASGVVLEVNFGDGVTRYELNDDRGQHDHLVCERCGKQVEFYDSEIEKLQDLIAEAAGFSITDRRTNIYGLCDKCRKK